MLKQELRSLFKKYDILIAPTMPILPFKFGEKIDDPIKMFMIDIDTVIANLAGVPAISVPAGFVMASHWLANNGKMNSKNRSYSMQPYCSKVIPILIGALNCDGNEKQDDKEFEHKNRSRNSLSVNWSAE